MLEVLLEGARARELMGQAVLQEPNTGMVARAAPAAQAALDTLE